MSAAPAAQASTVRCGASSLFWAVKSAPSGSTIHLTRGCVYRLTAVRNRTYGPNGLPVIRKKLTIDGNGATIMRSTASGTPAFRFFYIAPGANLILNRLTLRHGLASGTQGGGAVYNRGALLVVQAEFASNAAPALDGGAIDNAGNLRVWRSDLRYNFAQNGGGVFNKKNISVVNTTFARNGAGSSGGAIFNPYGNLSVQASTFVNNTASEGGAVGNPSVMPDNVIRFSTFFANKARSQGGAVANLAGGELGIMQSTLSANSAPQGGDLYNSAAGYVMMRSTIFAQGMGGGGNCDGTRQIVKHGAANEGYNLDTGASCGFGSAQHSMSDTQPRLEELGWNGGPTQTLGLPPRSPAINEIPWGGLECLTTNDQRGVMRPQDHLCDIGAYEYISSPGIKTPPGAPAHLRVIRKTSHSVSLRWGKPAGSTFVTRYTVFRNGKAVGWTGGPNATGFVDMTAAPSTSYRYQVAAYDGTYSSSPWSSPVYVTTKAPSGISHIQGAAVTTAGQVSSVTITLPQPVRAGDLLAGWFGQFGSAGNVSISDNVNGAWTRSAATAATSGSGDIAMFYVQNSASAPWGLRITIRATSAALLRGIADEYSGVARSGALNRVVVGRGAGIAAVSGSTPWVGSGELLFSGLLTGGSPGTVTVNGGLVIRAHSGGMSAVGADRIIATSGSQDVTWNMTTSTDWYEVAAVFRKA